MTAVAGRPTRLDVGGSEAQPAELVLESGETRHVALLPARGRLRVPAIAEIGYHRLRVEDREIVLAVSPARCRSIEDVVPDARLWGLAAQLYGLNHPGDVGIGDLAGRRRPGACSRREGGGCHRVKSHARALRRRSRPVWPVRAVQPTVPEPASRRAGARLRTHHQGGTEFGERPDRLAGRRRARNTHCCAVSLSHSLDGDDWDGPLGADFARYRADQGSLLYEHACFEALQAGAHAAAGMA